ncbi:MAG: AAA family ATPase, partial [Patescibacteria group bacterium]|nr:AAA family ATPase [Patescibacteria group bacterium]
MSKQDVAIWIIGIQTGPKKEEQYSSYEELKKRRVVAQGWPELQDLSCLYKKTEKKIRKGINILGTGSENVRVFINMLKEIKHGDIVIGAEGTRLKGVCQIPEGVIYGYDNDGSFTAINPSEFNKDDFNYAHCLFPVVWVDWDMLGIPEFGPGGQGVSHHFQNFRPDNQKDRNTVLNAWENYKTKTKFEVFPESNKKHYKIKKHAFNARVKACIKNLEDSVMKESYQTIEASLVQFGQTILYGPPGTGKTFLAKKFAEEHWKLGRSENESGGFFKIVQFHPSYNYEDFVRGVQVRTEKNDQDKSEIVYESVNRILGHMAQAALIKWEKAKKEAKETLGENTTKNDIENIAKEAVEKFVLIIDEINRANLAAVLGELIYALEYRDKPVETPYEVEATIDGQKGAGKTTKLTIPPNFYIIGTMNTADRSIGHIDYAVRRRFAFIPCPPDAEVIKNYYQEEKIKKKAEALFDATAKLFSDHYLSPDFHKDDVQVGHTYFLVDKSKNKKDMANELAQKFIYQVYPLLKEYYKDGIFKESESIEIIIPEGPKINIKDHLNSEKINEIT